MKNVFYLTSFLLLLSCNSEEKPGNKSLTESQQEAIFVSASFLDSVEKRYDLSYHQIAKYTIIDRAYYTRVPNATFAGDTVWDLDNGLKAALIDYSDALVCSQTFMAVFLPDSMVSTDVKEIRTACDADLSFSYTTLEYALPVGSTFETITTTYPPETEEAKEDSVVTVTLKWMIDSRGKIDTLR